MSLSDKKFEIKGYDDYLFEIQNVKEFIKELKDDIEYWRENPQKLSLNVILNIMEARLKERVGKELI